jgi:hypothetical protein
MVNFQSLVELANHEASAYYDYGARNLCILTSYALVDVLRQLVY